MNLVDYQKMQQERIEILRKDVANRPKHAAFLETLLASTPEAVWEVGPQSGVSRKAVEALRQDVSWCLTPPRLVENSDKVDYQSTGHFLCAYATLRRQEARAASRRKATQSGPEILQDLLQL